MRKYCLSAVECSNEAQDLADRYSITALKYRIGPEKQRVLEKQIVNTEDKIENLHYTLQVVQFESLKQVYHR